MPSGNLGVMKLPPPLMPALAYHFANTSSQSTAEKRTFPSSALF
jgi:hypothetical protein